MKLLQISLIALMSLSLLSCGDDDESESVEDSLVKIVENNPPTDGFDFPVKPGEMDGWKEPPPGVVESDPNFDPSSYLAERSDGFHASIDFYKADGSDAGGTELWSMGAGVVIDLVYDRVTYPDKHDGSDNDVGWGNLILIQHDYIEDGANKRVYALYAHCKTIDVKLNQIVTRGQRVGTIGGTDGKVETEYDNHLHFELRKTNLNAHADTKTLGLNTIAKVSEHYLHPLEFIRAHRPKK